MQQLLLKHYKKKGNKLKDFSYFSHISVVQEQDGKRPDDHKDPDDESERTTPGKSPKSPQKSSKRLKTVPFKVTLLDSSDYEAGIEVR